MLSFFTDVNATWFDLISRAAVIFAIDIAIVLAVVALIVLTRNFFTALLAFPVLWAMKLASVAFFLYVAYLGYLLPEKSFGDFALVVVSIFLAYGALVSKANFKMNE